MLRLWWVVVVLLQWELSRRRRMLLLRRRLRLGRGVSQPLCCYRSVMLCLRLIIIRRMMLLLRPWLHD